VSRKWLWWQPFWLNITSRRKGNAPRSVIRVDKGKVFKEQDNVHFKDGSALNKDGTWKHVGKGKLLTTGEKKWLLDHGWKLPKSDYSKNNNNNSDKKKGKK
jgi:hypothetical protein